MTCNVKRRLDALFIPALDENDQSVWLLPLSWLGEKSLSPSVHKSEILSDMMRGITVSRMAKCTKNPSACCQAVPSAKVVAVDVAAGDGKTYEQTQQVHIPRRSPLLLRFGGGNSAP